MRCVKMSGLQQISRLGGYLNGGKRSINGHLHNIIIVLLISKLKHKWGLLRKHKNYDYHIEVVG